MNLRLARPADIPAISNLFKASIEVLAANDYTAEQIIVWTSEYDQTETWQTRLNHQYFLVAESAAQTLAGIASLDATGYLDLLYVHPDFQRQGIATGLVAHLEQYAFGSDIAVIRTEASLTAKPFFESHGYRVVAPQQKNYQGITFATFTMQKLL